MRAFPEVPVGLSDHSLGISVPQAAVALGRLHRREALHGRQDAAAARPDHHLSVDPPEMKAMVDGIRTVEKALGKAQKGAGAAGEGGPPLRAAQRHLEGARSREGHGHHARDADLQTARAPASARGRWTSSSDASPASTSPETRPSAGRWCRATPYLERAGVRAWRPSRPRGTGSSRRSARPGSTCGSTCSVAPT